MGITLPKENRQRHILLSFPTTQKKRRAEPETTLDRDPGRCARRASDFFRATGREKDEEKARQNPECRPRVRHHSVTNSRKTWGAFRRRRTKRTRKKPR